METEGGSEYSTNTCNHKEEKGSGEIRTNKNPPKRGGKGKNMNGEQVKTKDVLHINRKPDTMGSTGQFICRKKTSEAEKGRGRRTRQGGESAAGQTETGVRTR